MLVRILAVIVVASACGADPVPPLATAKPGVVFTYPADAQLDVPLGTRIVVAFSEPIAAGAIGACSGTTGALCVVGPDGAVAAMPAATSDGMAIELVGAPLAPGTRYQVFVGAAVDPAAQNLPASGPLFAFTTRSERPRAAPPTLVAVNGGDPAMPESFRPMLDTSTIRLVFSEPLDARTVALAAGSVELVDMATGAPVAATVLAHGIHVAIDPRADLDPHKQYALRLGSRIADLGGQPLAPRTITLAPRDSRGAGAIPQVLRTRQMADPGPATTRAGATANVIELDTPLIGKASSTILPGSLAAELGDPKALGGPLAFRIPRGQRVRATSLDVKLGGALPSGLSTGEIEIVFLTDAGGRIYRNPHQDPTQRPENLRAPLHVDLSFDVAVYAIDPTGNAVLAQTVLGVQAAGTASADGGVLAIETMTSMELGLLGIAAAPTNLVLQLVTDAAAMVPPDQTAPTLIAHPTEIGVDQGVDLVFSEPIDLDRARAGGIQLVAGANVVPAVIESHGAAVVVRPLAPLAYATRYQVNLVDVADLAGNPLAATTPLDVRTPALVGTSAPLTATAVHPGVPCALTAATRTSPGRCAGGDGADDGYQPFTLAANERIEVAFSQPPQARSIVHGTSCNAGSIRIEQVDASGACVAAVPGTLLARDRSIAFVPDAPWTEGTTYRLSVISGGDRNCDAGELCGPNGDAASFDPLAGASGGGAAGGPDLVIPFTAIAATGASYLFAEATPFTDVNGSGTVDGAESLADDNRAALRITGTHGIVSSAHFNGNDCIASTPETEACIYLAGAMPVDMQGVMTSCPLPDGTTAPTCIPVTLSPQAMYGTSVSMTANAFINLTTDTGATVIRLREPAGAPVTGYIVDRAGTPTLVLALVTYMDAPDMSVPLSSHDLHSKPLTIALEGPVTFRADGRIAIATHNVADVALTVNIHGPLGASGAIDMVIPQGEMHLQLVSRPPRGAPP